MIAIVINPLSVGFSHAVFDAVLLKAIDEGLGNRLTGINFLGEKQHVIEIKNILGSWASNITFTSFRKYGRGRPAKTLLCARVFHQLNKTKSLNRQVLPIIAAADNTLTPLYLRQHRLKTPVNNMPPVIISHNNMQSIAYKKAKRRRWQKAVEKSRAKFMVLENELFEHARSILGLDKVFKLDHPTYGHIRAFERARQLRQQQPFLYDFLMIGRHGRTKACVEEVLQAAEQVVGKSSINNDDRSICIAFTGPEMGLLSSDERVQLFSLGEYPDFNKYLAALARSRFVVFPSTAGTRMTASGTLADALSLGTPVIAPAQGGFKICIENFKEFDHLFYEGKEGLKSSIKYALALPNKDYKMVCELMDRAAKKHLQKFKSAVCLSMAERW